MNLTNTSLTNMLISAMLLAALTACSTAETATSDAKPATEATTAQGNAELSSVLASDHRSMEAKARDNFRNPEATLTFFGLAANQTVVELLPGGGWYTDIIAPYIAASGQYFGAGYAMDIPDQPEYRYRLGKALEKKFAEGKAKFGNAQITAIAPPTHVSIAPAGSADLVLTFRNFHGFLREDPAPVMDAVVSALKPGGIFGVVQHRAPAGMDVEEMKTSGYVAEQLVIDYATAAGLELVARSEINANPKDTKDHPKGVWTLPPSYRLGEEDRAKYKAIGESDRMTLKFRKPQ